MINFLDCTLLISSTDKSEELWKYYTFFHNYYWSNCPINVVLVNETVQKKEDYIFEKQLLINEDSWSSMIIKALKLIDTKYIIFNFDDQWPIKSINNSELIVALNVMEQNKIGCLQIYSNKSNKTYKISFGEKYRMSCSTSIWNRDFLLTCLRENENPWEFEKNGSNRISSNSMDVYVYEKNIFPYLNVLKKGKVRREAFIVSKSHGIKLKIKNRKKQHLIPSIIEKIRLIIFDLRKKRKSKNATNL